MCSFFFFPRINNFFPCSKKKKKKNCLFNFHPHPRSYTFFNKMIIAPEGHLIEVAANVVVIELFTKLFCWLKKKPATKETNKQKKKNKRDFKTRRQTRFDIRPQCLFSSVVSTYRYNTVSFCKTKKKLPLQSSMLTECQSSRLHPSLRVHTCHMLALSKYVFPKW